MKFNNGYTFNMGDYSTSDKLLYREYFNWNVYGYSSENNEGTDGEKIRQVLILSISQYNAIFDKIKLRLLIYDVKIAFY